MSGLSRALVAAAALAALSPAVLALGEEPAPEPAEESSGWGCLTKMIGAGVLLLVGVGAYFGFTGGDDEDTIEVGSDPVTGEVVEEAEDPVTDQPAEPERDSVRSVWPGAV